MIRAYVGLLGQGKTLSMINDALPHLYAGRKVFTNTPFKLELIESLGLISKIMRKKAGHELLLPHFMEKGEDFRRALKTETDSLFLIDEASIVFSTYAADLLSGDYVMRFAQSRKFGNDIYYTTQSFTHTHKRLRDLSNEVVRCSYRRLPLLGALVGNVAFNPERFLNPKMPSKFEKDFILWKRWIFGEKLKFLYRCYDTSFVVRDSMNLEISSEVSYQTSKQYDLSKVADL